MNNNFYIGIDPGISGGIACLSEAGEIHYKTVMPVITEGTRNRLDAPAIAKWLKERMNEAPIRMIGIEQQQAMPKQGVTSCFIIGKGFGLLEGIVAALELPYMIIRSHNWQKVMFQSLPKNKTKALSAKVAAQLFPKEDFKKSSRCTNVHDGLTDAALIAEYIRRKIK